MTAARRRRKTACAHPAWTTQTHKFSELFPERVMTTGFRLTGERARIPDSGSDDRQQDREQDAALARLENQEKRRPDRELVQDKVCLSTDKQINDFLANIAK